MAVDIALLIAALLYRTARRKPDAAAQRREDRIARLAGVLSLVALIIVGFVVVGYGMGMAMSAGGAASGIDKAIRVIIFIPAILASFALARAHSKLSALCALPSLAVYFIPALQRNLGI